MKKLLLLVVLVALGALRRQEGPRRLTRLDASGARVSARRRSHMYNDDAGADGGERAAGRDRRASRRHRHAIAQPHRTLERDRLPVAIARDRASSWSGLTATGIADQLEHRQVGDRVGVRVRLARGRCLRAPPSRGSPRPCADRTRRTRARRCSGRRRRARARVAMTSSTPRCSPIGSTVSIGDDEMITVLRPARLCSSMSSSASA